MIGSIIRLSRWISEGISGLFAKATAHNDAHPRLSAASSEQTLVDALRKTGFESFTAYAESVPLVALAHLAEQLGGEEWALHTRLLIEAERVGSTERYARGLFIRHLHQGTPPDKYFGMLGPSWAVDLALYRTALSMPRKYRIPCMRVALGYMRAEVGFNWKPEHPEETAVKELFATYWPEASIAFFAPNVRMSPVHGARLPRLVIDGRDSVVSPILQDRARCDQGHSDDAEFPPPPQAA